MRSHCWASALLAPDGSTSGVHIDSADHRSHLSYPVVDPDTGTSTFPWSCSDRRGRLVVARHGRHAGSSFHADCLGAWDPTFSDAWLKLCIHEYPNWIGAELSDGHALRMQG